MTFICWDDDDPDNDEGSARKIELPEWRASPQAAACKWAEDQLKKLFSESDAPRFDFDVWVKDPGGDATHWYVHLELSYTASARESKPKRAVTG